MSFDPDVNVVAVVVGRDEVHLAHVALVRAHFCVNCTLAMIRRAAGLGTGVCPVGLIDRPRAGRDLGDLGSAFFLD